MSAPHRSAISWTDYSGGDANFVTGCTPVSEGCRNCYARAIYERFGKDFETVTENPEALDRLFCWKPKPPWKRMDSTRPYTERPMCFVCDTGDLFHPEVPTDVADYALNVMVACDKVDWQVLTKRPWRMQVVLSDWLYRGGRDQVPPNIWLGVSVENQARADERMPLLLEVPAAVRFVSVEPMLGPVDLVRACDTAIGPGSDVPAVEGIGRWLHWVICGAESGPNRRPFDVQWALDLYEQCREAGVPFFYKQGSALRPGFNVHLPGYGVVQEWPRV